MAAAGLVAASIAAAVARRPAPAPGPCTLAAGPSVLREIPEASGLALSRRSRGVIWSHNDSGNDAVLFALDLNGAPVGRVRVPVVTRDWEDVSAGNCLSGPCLYIADIGDNGRVRPEIQIYRVPEPAPNDAATAWPERITARYGDGPHNAEALFVVGDELFIVTKDRAGGVYRAAAPGSSGAEMIFERIGELHLEPVTDAEATPDEKVVAVRTPYEVVLYRSADLVRGVVSAYARIPVDWLREAQGEGVALDADGWLYLASEGGAGALRRLRCELP